MKNKNNSLKAIKKRFAKERRNLDFHVINDVEQYIESLELETEIKNRINSKHHHKKKNSH